MRLSRQTKVGLLKPIPLFAGCSRSELEAVSRVADELWFAPGRVIMQQGTPGRELVVLVDGEVTIERNGKKIATRRSGDFFGELALVTGRPRSASVIAATELQTLVLDGRSFDRLLRDVPTIAAKVLKAVAERLPAVDD